MQQNGGVSRRILTGFIVGFGGMAFFATVAPAARVLLTATRIEYTPTVDAAIKHEVSMVFVGSPDCTFSTSPEVLAAVRTLKVQAAAATAAAGIPFRAIGVSVNDDPEDGIRFLARFGQFDEISAGGYYGNASAQRFIFGKTPGPAATPQVIILERIHDPDGPPGSFRETVLSRLSGASSILEASREAVFAQVAHLTEHE